MKKLLLFLSLLPIVMISARNNNDTIFLKNGKYYVCHIMSANATYIEYSSALPVSLIERTNINEQSANRLPDVIYKTDGGKMMCKITKQTENRIYYNKEVATKVVKSLHYGNGRIEYPSHISDAAYHNADREPRTFVATQRPIEDQDLAAVNNTEAQSHQMYVSQPSTQPAYESRSPKVYIASKEPLSDSERDAIWQQTTPWRFHKHVPKRPKTTTDNAPKPRRHHTKPAKPADDGQPHNYYIATQRPLDNQEPTAVNKTASYDKLTLKDGSVLKGRIISATSDEVQFESAQPGGVILHYNRSEVSNISFGESK